MGTHVIRHVHHTRRATTRLGLAASLGAAVATIAALGMLVAPSAPAGANGANSAPPQGGRTTEAPLPADASTNPGTYLASATCPAQNGCVDVGWYDDTSFHTWGLIETQSGTDWADTQAPQPANSGTGSNQGFWFGSQNCGFTAPCRAVSCPTASFCVAVGQYTDSAGYAQAVVDTYANGSWTSATAALPADAATDFSADNPHNWLYSVSCASTASCVAVGQYVNTSGNATALVDVLSGTTWTGTAAPLPAGASPNSSQLFGVSCASASSCVANGQYVDNATSGGFPLLLTMAHGTWTPASGPLPANAAAGGSQHASSIQVSCASPSFCVAAGLYFNTDSVAKPLIDTWDGTSWTAVGAPLLPSDQAPADFDQLNAVSCPTPSFCVATGTYGATSGKAWGLIDTWSGGAWSAMKAPEPSNTAVSGAPLFGQLVEVSCPTPAFCLTTGSYSEAGNITTAYIDTYSAGAWSSITAPLPTNATVNGSVLSQGRSVACYSPVSCAVGGQYQAPAGRTQGFLGTFTGMQGYWLVASDGGVLTYGNAHFNGSAGNLRLSAPMVGMATTPDRAGYWMVATDGGIFDYGDAGFFGSRGGKPLNKPVVGMASSPSGLGYWLVASDGGIFAYGDAAFYGSTGSLTLNKPVVGMAATPDGGGYWLVASDGGIFAYGDAAFYGSTGSHTLNKPVVGMAASPSGLGYWLVASDGGIFAYGDAAFYGSTGSITLNKPVVGMASSPSGNGYWLVASDGGIFNYGDANFYGSAGGLPLNEPVVGMAA